MKATEIVECDLRANVNESVRGSGKLRKTLHPSYIRMKPFDSVRTKDRLLLQR